MFSISKGGEAILWELQYVNKDVGIHREFQYFNVCVGILRELRHFDIGAGILNPYAAGG